jgi:hypothetical protein
MEVPAGNGSPIGGGTMRTSARFPEGVEGFTEEAAKPLGGVTAFTDGSCRLPAGVAVFADKRNNYGSGKNAFISGGVFTSRQPWGKVRWASWKAEKPGGQSTPRCGGLWTGRQEADCNEKNTGMDAGVFLYLTDPDHGEGADPPPLSR